MKTNESGNKEYQATKPRKQIKHAADIYNNGLQSSSFQSKTDFSIALTDIWSGCCYEILETHY